MEGDQYEGSVSHLPKASDLQQCIAPITSWKRIQDQNEGMNIQAENALFMVDNIFSWGS